MTDSHEPRARRGLFSEDEETFEPTELDDTPAPTRARRAEPVEEDIDDWDDELDPVDETDEPREDEPPAHERGDASTQAEAPQRSPFARPDSVDGGEPESFVPSPVMPQRFADIYPEETGPAPRRSALSSITPPELDAVSDSAPRRSAVSPVSPASGPTPASPSSPDSPASPAEAPADGGSWWQHHRRSLVTWAAVIIAAALVVASVTYFVRRANLPAGPSPSPSPSETIPPLDESALLTEKDAAAISGTATWAIPGTSTDPADQRGRAACLSTDPDLINPTISLQRPLGTTEENKLAALHQIDVYADEAAAKEVLAGRFTSLASCSEVPARIVSSSTIEGLADETHQLTVVYENEETQFHTVLLARTGNALSILDVTQLDEPVEAEALASALQRSLTKVCSYDGTCPTDKVEVTPVVVPPTEPVGWLVPSDLPRLRPGIGRWSTTGISELTNTKIGMGCEFMTLATETGPTQREQNTLVILQDDKTSEGFGLDEFRFTFEDGKAAKKFAKKLGDNLAGCQEQSMGTTVKEYKDVESVGADDTKVTARTFTIERETADDSVYYQLAVTVSGDRVSYLLGTVEKDYRFSEVQLAEIAKRMGERATQA